MSYIIPTWLVVLALTAAFIGSIVLGVATAFVIKYMKRKRN